MELCVLGAGTVAGAQVYEAVSEGSAAHPIFIVVEAIVPIMVVGGLASAEYIRKNATLLIKSGTDKIASAFLLRITNY